jgi:serine protease Do
MMPDKDHPPIEPRTELLTAPQPPHRKSRLPLKWPTINTRIATVLLALIASVSAGFVGGYYGSHNNASVIKQTQEARQQIVSSESGLNTQIAKDVGPSVVSVNVTSQGVQQSLFGARNVTQESAGTGVIISSDGIIVTNRHVVPKGTTTVSVTLSDGTELKDVSVIGRTNDTDPLDVAFLKVNDKKGKDLKAAKLGDSSKMQVGDKVIAIGNALGQFQNTVTTGIISGYGRSVEAGDETSSETLQNLFQTDAAINQGNSGGPLVNVQGEVIGINTAIAGDAQNIGFAIPINDLQGLIKSVLKEGKLLRPYLGVSYISLTDDYAYQYNLDTKRGAYIVPSDGNSPSILSGSPAEKAGLKEKDIIAKVNDTPIDENHSLTSVLGQSSVGDKVKLTIIRDSKTITVDVTLEAAPSS